MHCHTRYHTYYTYYINICSMRERESERITLRYISEMSDDLCFMFFFSDSRIVSMCLFHFPEPPRNMRKVKEPEGPVKCGWCDIWLLSSTWKKQWTTNWGRISDLQILHCTLLRICENTDDWSPLNEEKHENSPFRPSAGKEYDSLWKGMKELANIPAGDTASKRLEIRHTVDGRESLRQLVDGLSHHNPILVSVFHWNPNSYRCRMAGLFIPSMLQPNRGVWETTERYNSAGPSNCHLLKRWLAVANWYRWPI